jgi:haloalkane dehalogenase
MRVLRTPEERFAGLPGFAHEPRYAEVPDGLRMAYVEAGPADGEPVVLLHGEPSWSFLYRDVMPELAAAGLRAIAVDLVGFGRSDKPADVGEHTYARHVEWTRSLLYDALGLTGVTMVGQDWGGLIGLRLAAEHPDRVARIVAANTGLPTGDIPMPEVWHRFKDAVVSAPALDRRSAPPTTPPSPTRRTRRDREPCRRSCPPRPKTRPRRRTASPGRSSPRSTGRSSWPSPTATRSPAAWRPFCAGR